MTRWRHLTRLERQTRVVGWVTAAALVALVVVLAAL